MRCAVALLLCLLCPALAQAEDFAPRAKLRSHVAAQFGAIREPSIGPARAIGKINAGCLAGGIALPLTGPGWQVARPARRRHYGHPDMIAFIQRLAGKAQDAGIGLLTIADIGLPRGGPFFNGHASHQRGLDADIWYATGVTQGAEPTAPVTPIEAPQIQLLRWAAEDPATERIFVAAEIKQALCAHVTEDRAWLSRIRPAKGHGTHFHVRLACPADSPQCLNESGVATGTGCPGDGAGDAGADGNAPNLRLIRSMIRMPVACMDLLKAKSGD